MEKVPLNKRDLIKKFLLPPKKEVKIFYQKEYKLLNDLISSYSAEFVQVLTLQQKYDSLAVLFSDSYKKDLDLRFKHFNYKIEDSKYEDVKIGEKSGQDVSLTKKNRTIRDILNG